MTHPSLYVPPAWALGALSSGDLKKAPYRMIETTSGVRLPASAKCRRLPLTGFEADTSFREFFLRRWNRAQCKWAIKSNKPLRISLHPDDLQLRVVDQLEEFLRLEWEFLSYRQLDL